MDIEVTRPPQGWTERALSFRPGTVVQYRSVSGQLTRVRNAAGLWQVQGQPGDEPRTLLSCLALLQDLGQAPRLRVLAAR